MLKPYGIYIKSHSEAPDYENECEAESKEEAAQIFARQLSNEIEAWDYEMVLPYVVEL